MLNILKSLFSNSTKVDYRPGDVFLFAGRASLSKLIALSTASPFSHAGILYDANTIFEAEIATGVTATSSFQRILNYHGDIWHLPLRRSTYPVFQKQRFQAYLNSQKNRGGYDFPTLARLIIQKLKEKGISVPSELEQVQNISPEQFALLLSKVWVSKNSVSLLTNQELSMFTCSGLVAQALKEGGLVPNSLNALDATPSDLCNWSLYENSYNKLKGNKSLPVTYNTFLLR